MWIAKAVSLTVLTPLAAMLAAGAISACLSPSPESTKNPEPLASAAASPRAAAKEPAPAAPPSSAAAAARTEAPPPSSANASSPPEEPAADPDPPTPEDAPAAFPQKTRAQCTSLWDGMQQKVERFDGSHSACKSDTDCATVPGRVCLGACDTAVAKDAVKERDALFSSIDRRECKAFIDGCSRTLPIPVPSCPIYAPACVGGRCAAKMK